MTTLIVLFAVAAILWAIVAARYLSLPLNCLLVILAGVVVGHAFYNRSVGPIPVTIDRVLWGMLIVQFLILWRMGRADRKPLDRTDMIVLGLAVLLTASTLLHDWSYKDNLPLSRLLFFNWMPIGIYFVAKNCRLSTRHLALLYAALVAFGLYLGFTAIAEQRGWHALVFPRYILDPQYVEFLGRARGPFLNPVSCGIFLTASAVATVFWWPRLNQLGRGLIIAAVSMLLVAAFLTFTRSVWVGAAMAAGIVIWIPATRVTRGGLLITATLCAFVFVTFFSDRVNSFKRDKYVTVAEMSQSASLRPMLAHVAFKMFRDRPLLGCGFGQYTQVKKPYHYEETAEMPLRRVLPYMQHNVFLSYLTETGLVGLGLLVSLLASLAIKSWRLWRASELSLWERQLGLLGLVVMSNYCINGLFHDVSIIPHVAAIFFLLLGLVGNVTAQQVRRASLELFQQSRDETMAHAA